MAPAAGYGYVIHRNGLTLTSGNGRLGPAEVFDAEAKGALEGLRAALNLTGPRHIFVCLDNLGVASCLRGMPADSSQEVFLEFQALATTHGAVEVRWIPGHTNIAGNEQADALAKAATSMPEPADALPTLAHLRRTARQQSRDAFEAWWDASAPDQYKPLHLKPTTSCPPELELPRPLLHHLLAARSRHGDFADYHERFNHDDARLSCSCGRRKEPSHLFYCRKILPRHRMRLTPSPIAAINRAIGRDFDKFVKLAKASSFFEWACARDKAIGLGVGGVFIPWLWIGSGVETDKAIKAKAKYDEMVAAIVKDRKDKAELVTVLELVRALVNHFHALLPKMQTALKAMEELQNLFKEQDLNFQLVLNKLNDLQTGVSAKGQRSRKYWISTAIDEAVEKFKEIKQLGEEFKRGAEPKIEKI
ncbi:hypothetical protein PCL_09626 [Purpureocillium lilacinum]|uniref:RNase H type-1 domain-containing protein n=1 Tax=Purpureocillium lilacinum TaxID=33203 RepID=A0A2U3DQE5_PURLI|nr:hypothetical protein PCL_09626 [Purpureocillium lilacinum]